MPKPILVNQSPHPGDPATEARERLDITKYPPASRPTLPSTPAPFAQQVRQQMSLLDGEIARLEAQIETLTQQCADQRYQRQHLAAYLAVAVHEQA